MSKVKAVIVALILAAGAGGGAFYGLNLFAQKQIEQEAISHLAKAEMLILDSLRVDAFQLIQNLSRESSNADLLAGIAKTPDHSGQSGEALKGLLGETNTGLKPAIDGLQGKLKVTQLDVLSSQGVSLAGAPKNVFGTSYKGLPAVQECLSGISRDAFYEMDGKLSRIGVSPIRDQSGAIAGCLLASTILDKSSLAALQQETGLDVALYLRKTLVASTVDAAVATELAKRVDGQSPIAFGNPSTALPIMVDLTGKAHMARVTPIPGGTDPVHLAVVFDVAARYSSVKEAQMMVFYGTGGLFLLGLILGLLLAGPKVDKQAQRLRDSISLMADGSNGYSIDESGYSGIYQDIVQSITKISGSLGQSSAPRPAESVSQLLGPSAPPPDKGADDGSSSLDFESLLGSQDDAAAPSQPAAATPAPAGPATPPAAMPAAAVSAPPAAAASAPAASQPEPAGPGPKVEMPGDLASFFDDDGDEDGDDHDATREFDAMDNIPPEARPPQPAPAPAPPVTQPEPASSSPPPPISAFGEGGPDMLDTGDDDFDDYDDDDDQVSSSDYRPDATVIAQVPDELLKAAADSSSDPGAGAQASGSVPPPPTALPSPPIAAQPVRAVDSPEDAHFKEVFSQFVQTKKQCGEAIGGLTEPKFVEKLRKNSSDLKARYSCKSVRFQVYVKNGKAALKATPVK